ncbi:ATP-binding protein [Streptomyces sp. NBC_01341]|uniref:ATP-binding protein n=1 Tax=Streptomyces sp. NBC_01341 TaxID=2903831 RepID=UPI002E14EB0B|nr:ATP-binding protein [Streptomyces sp. NBC_01341]
MPAPRTQAPVRPRAFAQRFSATRRGARLARLLAALQLVEWGHPRGSEHHDTVTVVVAELAANAVLHGLVPGRDFALFLAHDDSRGITRVEVSDTHPSRPAHDLRPAHVAPALDEDHGRGLVLVDALAVRWGVRDRLGPGKTVWAECGLSERPGTPGHGEPAAPGAGAGQEPEPWEAEPQR